MAEQTEMDIINGRSSYLVGTTFNAGRAFVGYQKPGVTDPATGRSVAAGYHFHVSQYDGKGGEKFRAADGLSLPELVEQTKEWVRWNREAFTIGRLLNDPWQAELRSVSKETRDILDYALGPRFDSGRGQRDVFGADR